jgi:4-hydroxy-tetrahydrodipicolinate synthase
MLGLGGNNTLNLTDTIARTNFDGIAGILSVTPFYNKPNQRGLLQHYRSVAEASPVPVVIYNVPGRTGVNLAAETTLTLANECPNIIGIKEASGNIQQAMEILRQRPAGFRVISGDDALTYPLLALGADGVISVIANALPKEMSDMVRLAMKGDLKKALPLQMKMLPLMNAIFDEGNPTGIKALLEIQGSITNILRLPLVKASKTLTNKLSTLYNEFKN